MRSREDPYPARVSARARASRDARSRHAAGGGGVDPWRLARRRWPVALIASVVTVGAMLVVLAQQTTPYRTEALLAVAPPPGSQVPPAETARTARAVLSSETVSERASRALGGDPTPSEARDRTLITADPEGWATLTTTYDGPSREAAAGLARTSLAIGLPVARGALPAGSRLVVATPPATPDRVDRPLALIAFGVAFLAVVIGALAAIAVEALDIHARRRSA